MKDNKKIFENVFLYIVVLLSISSIIIPKYIGDLDEIWNYNFANCISNDLIPYKDFNIVITPLLSMIEGLIFKILPNELIIMRILAILLSSSILFIIYKILEKLKINKRICIISTIAIGYLLKDYFCIDYNFFVLFLSLIIIYLEIKNTVRTGVPVKQCKQIKLNFLIGILAGLCITTKQTTGIFISIAITIYPIILLLYNIFKHRQNNTLNVVGVALLSDPQNKRIILKLIIRIIGILLPVIILIIYLVINGAIYDFFDYCILGIKTFNNKISYINLIKSEQVIIKILSILVPVSWTIMAITTIVKKDKKIFIILLISMAEFIVAYPISDNIHFLIGATPSFIGIIYTLNLLKLKIKLRNEVKLFFKFFFEYLSITLVAIVLILGIYNNYKFFTNQNNYSTFQHFKYIQISEELENKIKIVDEYIENSNEQVYILDSDAALYMIPVNKYNKNFDMFNKGNLGSKGEQGQIEYIKSLNNVKILIRKDGLGLNWQTPMEVRSYIKQNLTKIDTIEIFDVYQK